jgi:hypothetical protein
MRQKFEAPEALPPFASLAAITGGTAEVNLFSPSIYTPIPAGYAEPGMQWILEAYGVCTYPATTPGTTAFTARIGASATPASNVICGAASAAAQGTTQTGVQWHISGLVTCRSVGLPGANSVMHGRFTWECPLALQAAGVSGQVIFGGSATVDLSVAQAVAISLTPSVTGQSFTVDELSFRSL